MIRRPPRSTRVRSSAASDVYKRQRFLAVRQDGPRHPVLADGCRFIDIGTHSGFRRAVSLEEFGNFARLLKRSFFRRRVCKHAFTEVKDFRDIAEIEDILVIQLTERELRFPKERSLSLIHI